MISRYAREPDRRDRSGGLVSLLSRVDDGEAAALDELRHPGGQHSVMLSSLIVTNCLLEVAKLAAQRRSLAEFVSSAARCLLEFAPIERCVVTLDPHELPAVLGVAGEWTPEELAALAATAADAFASAEVAGGSSIRTPAARGVSTAPIRHGSIPIGLVAMDGLPLHLHDAELVTRVAEQIDAFLDALIEAELLRRRAAASAVTEMLATVTEAYAEPELATIAELLQCLPGAVGAAVSVEVRRFGGPVEVRAGDCRESLPSSAASGPLDREGTAAVTITWADEQAREQARTDDVLDHVLTTLARAEQTNRLVAESETDDLTGIGNRRRGSRAVAHALLRAERTGEEIAVLMLDLDRFKDVNDTLGHAEGDRVLRCVAGSIERTIRAYDLAIRWGGEEFLVLCPSTDLDGARALAQRLLEALAAATEAETGIRRTVSIGIAVAPPMAGTPTELLRCADEALYRAKAAGRNRFEAGSSRRSPVASSRGRSGGR